MNRTRGKKGAGDQASAPTSKTTEATAGLATTASFLSGEEAALPVEGAHMGQTRTMLGQGMHDSSTATAARMEGIKRQSNKDGVIDMEVRNGILHVQLRL